MCADFNSEFMPRFTIGPTKKDVPGTSHTTCESGEMDSFNSTSTAEVLQHDAPSSGPPYVYILPAVGTLLARHTGGRYATRLILGKAFSTVLAMTKNLALCAM